MNSHFFMILMVILMTVIIMIFLLWFMKEMGFFTHNKNEKQYSSTIKEDNIMDDTILHQSEEYTKFELKTDLKNDTERILINIPERCPFCNQHVIEGYFNYKLKNKKYLTIPLCKEHYTKSRQKPSLLNRKIDIILILGFVLTLIIGITFYLITQNSSIFTLILIIDSIPLFVYVLMNVFEKARYNLYIGKINESVRFGYSKDTIIIIIRNSNWANEFRSLNNWKEIPYASKKIKTHREKGVLCAKILVLSILISIPIIIILLIYIPNYSKLIIYFLVLIPIFSIIMIWIFHILEEQALKTQPISHSNKKLAIIIISIFTFILITLGYFEVIQIF